MLMIRANDAVPALEERLYPEAAAADAVIEQLLTVLSTMFPD
jgi:hypothetical protein